MSSLRGIHLPDLLVPVRLMRHVRNVIHHPLTKLFSFLVWLFLAVRGFVMQGSFWDGLFTAMWIALAADDGFDLFLWYLRRKGERK